MQSFHLKATSPYLRVVIVFKALALTFHLVSHLVPRIFEQVGYLPELFFSFGPLGWKNITSQGAISLI